jgi:hypothetical protein
MTGGTASFRKDIHNGELERLAKVMSSREIYEHYNIGETTYIELVPARIKKIAQSEKNVGLHEIIRARMSKARRIAVMQRWC